MARWIVCAGLLVAACGDNVTVGADAALDARPIDAAPLCSTPAAVTDGETVMLAARDALLAYYQAHQEYPQGSIGPTPATGCCQQDFGGEQCCGPVAADWDVPLWRDVGVVVTAPSAYQFEYRSDMPASATLTGTRDQNCDGATVFVALGCSATIVGGPECTMLIRPAVPE